MTSSDLGASSSLDVNLKQLDDLRRQARVLRQQYAGTAAHRPEVAKNLKVEIVKVRKYI